jgi:tetratricopeptide (TPR) repeat protein
LHYNLGNLYKKKGKLDEAIGEYEKALSIQPDLTDAIDMLALVYMTRGEYEKAVSLFERVGELQPDNAGAYYNIACVYAIQNRVDESIDWLEKAIKRGYQNWDLIKNDKDLENIRGSSYYKEIIKGR